MNELEQVQDNLNTFKNFKPLNASELELIDSVKTKLKSVTKVGCTGCKYCLPCPQDVSIPFIFHLYNDYAMYKNEKYIENNYKDLVANKKDISKCVSCGACITKCPQGINPPEVFERFLDEMSFF